MNPLMSPKKSLHAECSNALRLLEHIQQTIDETDDVKLQAQTADDLNMLISVFSNPILRSIVCVEDSLRELNEQLQQHPSILPVDLHVTPSGDLSLSVPPADELYEPHFISSRQEVDDQRVPVAKLSHSSSTETSSSPQLGGSNATLPPITTHSYAVEFQKAIEEAARGREIHYVQLLKPEGSSLGFSVVGLKSEDRGELGIYIQEIQSNGIAGRDGNLREGDQILAIDGQPLDSNISHQQAINILQQARGFVELVVARGVEEDSSSAGGPTPTGTAHLRPLSPSAVSDTSKAGSDMVLNTEWAQVEVVELVNDGSGLGFGIIGGKSTGVVVKTILPGGVADRDGRLRSGDHILQIGRVNLRGMGSEQVAAVLRQSGSHVRLVVARPVETDYQTLESLAPIVPTKILTDPEELNCQLMQSGYIKVPVMDGYSDHYARDHDLQLLPDACIVIDTPSLPVLTMDMLPLESSELPEMETFTVELKKDAHGLGITIAGYVCEKEELSGIFVKSIAEGSAADLQKNIQVNDRIIEVDGQSLNGFTNHQAVEVLRSTGQVVKLSLERYLRGPKFEQLQQAIAASELKPNTTPSSPSALSLPRFPVSTDGESANEIEFERESNTTIDSGVLDPEDVLIDDNYEGVLKPSVEAAIKSKWIKIIGSDAEIIVAQLCKLSEGGGLGISLEGTVDVEHGKEVRPHHYIRSILSEGPVGRDGRLRSGDELLEVNGHRLLGMNHIEVVSILKDLPMNVRMVCARRDNDLNAHRIIIDTAQDKTAFSARNILGGSLQSLIPASDRLVKAKSDGSLASTTTTTPGADNNFSKLKSRSLEPLTGLAMWSSEPQIIELVKGERGLGFSILDYQDPMNPNETVIVIRSLVPGGVAQLDGQLIPGDRLVSVNDINLENASLDQAVQALKGAPKGVVRIGVAKPLPIPDSASQSQDDAISLHTPTVEDRSLLSSYESLSHVASSAGKSGKSEEKLAEEESDSSITESDGVLESDDGILGGIESEEGLLSGEDLEKLQSTDEELEKSFEGESNAELLQLMVPVASEKSNQSNAALRTPSTGDITDEDFDEENAAMPWGSDILHLPPSLEVSVKVHKGMEPLGISVDSVDRAVNGMLVVLVVPGGAVARDGRIRPGDYLISINFETLRNATNAQTRAILRRTQLLSTDISIVYIPGEAAAAYRKSFQNEPETPPPLKISKKSPRSPYVPSDSSVESAEEKEFEPKPYPSDYHSVERVANVDVVVGEQSVLTSSDEPFPLSQVPTPIDDETAVSTEDLAHREEARKPHSVCVVDGLFSVHSLKGNKVLVGVELSPKDSPVPKHRKSLISSQTDRTVISDFRRDSSYSASPKETDIITASQIALDSAGNEVTTHIEKTHPSFERDSFEKVVASVECVCPSSLSPVKQTATVEPSFQIAESSEEDFVSEIGLASPFPSPVHCSPPHRQINSDKMDKEASANILVAKHWGSARLVEITREPNCSLGISIVGGKVDLYNSGPDSASAISGIFIKNVLPNSPAGRLGELKTGDRILEVDSIDLRNASHERAVDVIRNAGAKVRFLVQSLVQWNYLEDQPEEKHSAPSYAKLQKVQAEDESEEESLRTPIIRHLAPLEIPRTPTPEVIQEGLPTTTKEENDICNGDESEDEEEDYRNLEGNIITAKGAEINRNSAGNVKRTAEEIKTDPEEEDIFGYTTNKVKKKYANLGESILVFQVERSHKGLGISLAGHKDRTKMAVYICGLNPNGTAYKAGGLQVGDEILEVNGIVLQGRCHLNASAIIKGLPGPTFKLIILRRKTALDDLAVKPITQFPVTLDDETPEQKYAKFKGLKTVSIKKGGHGLGIMIIEGKHAEVGQGIFISDIQEGSAAEQAGLMVGDMILAVNNDTLLGANYDTAASLLKKTEGVVTLVVCNPNKAREEEATSSSQGGLDPPKGLGHARSPLRSPTPSHKEEPRFHPKPPTLSVVPPKSPSQSSIKSDVAASTSLPTTIACSPCVPPPPVIITPKTSPALSSRKFVTFSEGPPPDPLTCPIVPGQETAIEINKDRGLGLSIIGGADSPLGCIVVHEIVPEGSAAKDGRLKTGDILLEVDSEDFRKINLEKAQASLRLAQQKVKMTVFRDANATEENLLQTSEIELTKKSGKGLGLSLVGRKGQPGVFISEILHGSVAESDGRLTKGDILLAVNGEDLRNTSQEAAAALLKAATGKVVIKYGRYCVRQPSASNGNVHGDLTETRSVILYRSIERGFGFSIIGGRDADSGDHPVLIKTIFDESPAAVSGLLQAGDEIVAVNDVPVFHLAHDEVVSLLRRTGSHLKLDLKLP